jgi:hypothetical protein
MPPATTTRSPPAVSASGHSVPNGPRTPATAPGSSAQSAFVTAPTARMVCVSGPSPSWSPLVEIGTSPTPNA